MSLDNGIAQVIDRHPSVWNSRFRNRGIYSELFFRNSKKNLILFRVSRRITFKTSAKLFEWRVGDAFRIWNWRLQWHAQVCNCEKHRTLLQVSERRLLYTVRMPARVVICSPFVRTWLMSHFSTCCFINNAVATVVGGPYTLLFNSVTPLHQRNMQFVDNVHFYTSISCVYNCIFSVLPFGVINDNNNIRICPHFARGNRR